MRRACFLALASLGLVVALVVGFVRLIVPRPPPASVALPAPVGPALTSHLVLVIVDGLRHDIAVDPSRMPHFARSMRERPSAEIWAGRVSMTSAAILTFATGQRGGVDQIVNNESGSKVAYNDLVSNARAAGLVTAFTGDRAWLRMFPDAWSMAHPDPQGVAIDVDYNAEIFAATREFLRAEPRPNLLVAHFVTPDHQAHAHGVLSDRYRAHMLDFDRSLRDLLASLPPDTTVFVTSDHGATDTGTHGSDTPVQRRSPLFAYGPGVAREQKEARALDQMDLPSTLAALLGVPAPAHGRGHVLADWLDVPDEERARIACADLDRLLAYAQATHRAETAAAALVWAGASAGACDAQTSPRDRIEAAAAVSARIDRSLGQATVGGLPLAWLVPSFALAAALALGLAVIGRRALPPLWETAHAGLFALELLAVSLALTYGLERLPGRWPNAARVALYALVHAGLLMALVRARAVADWLDRHAAFGAVVLPGLLVVTPTKTTQGEAFVVSVLITAAAVSIGVPRAGEPYPPRRAWGARPGHALLLLGLVAALWRLGFTDATFLPAALAPGSTALLAAAVLSIGVIAVERGSRAAARGEAWAWRDAALGAAVAITSLALRRSGPAPLCITGLVGMPVAAFFAWRRGRRALAELLLLGSYAWVSRDGELPILAATLVVASAVGHALAKSLKGRPPRPSAVLVLVTFLFAWPFLQRIGIQQGIDFIHLDWGAGAFRDRDVSIARVGLSLGYKHLLARGAVVFAVLAALPPAYRSPAVRGLLVAEVARAAALITMLYICGGSFWTAMRVIGDIPHALAAVVVAALGVVAVEASAAQVRPGRVGGGGGGAGGPGGPGGPGGMGSATPGGATGRLKQT